MDSSESLLQRFIGILPETSEEKVLRLLIDTGAQFVGAEEGALLVLDDEGDELCFVMVTGSAESEENLIGQRVPLGKGLTGLAATTREVQIGAPTYRDVKQLEEGGGESGIPSAVIAAPMLMGETLVGIITAVSFEKGKRFTSKDAELYGRLASIAGLVIDQRRRLAAGEKRVNDDASSPRSFGQAGRLEQEILATLGRLIKHNPGILEHVAQLLSAVEAIARPGVKI